MTPTPTLNRRGFLGRSAIAAGTIVASGALSPERAYAASMPPGWQLGFTDIEADIPAAPMRAIHGRLPADLRGRLYRNGPAKFHRPGGSARHWFDGDGLVRRYTLGDDGVRMTARFVDTPKRRQEERAAAMILPGFGTPPGRSVALTSNDDANAANISVMMAGDDLWALWEAGSPTRLDPDTLATRGVRTLGEGYEHMPFLAHPRYEPDGGVWNLGQAGDRLIVWQLTADRRLKNATPIEVPRASYIHDFTATDRHLVILLQPWIQVRDAMPILDGLQWRPALGTQVIVLDKDDLSRRRSFELPAFSFFHLGDAWVEGDGTIRFDACIYRDPGFAIDTARAVVDGQWHDPTMPVLAMIALHPDGRARLSPTLIGAEFPRSDPRRVGRTRRFTVHTRFPAAGTLPNGIGAFDWQRQRDSGFAFGDHQLCEEFVVVPAGRDEASAWLVGTTLNLAARATELHVLRLADLGSGPVASFRAETALPISFHGIFVA